MRLTCWAAETLCDELVFRFIYDRRPDKIEELKLRPWKLTLRLTVGSRTRGASPESKEKREAEDRKVQLPIGAKTAEEARDGGHSQPAELPRDRTAKS